MQVYGDRARSEDPRDLLDAIAAALAAADAASPARRREPLTRALIDAGELAQGLADAEFEARGLDDGSPTQDAAMALATAVARRLHAAWRGGFAEDVAPASAEVAALAALDLPARVRCKTPEGYAFYAIYPEAYFAAAALRPWPRPPLVIGLRSIGTSLAAAVAAASGGQAISLRPTGHPFDRELRVSAALAGRIRAHAGPIVIADEGPGLSGSSFAAAAKLLDALGAAPDRVVFAPSHRGPPGAVANPGRRAQWAGAQRLVTTFDDMLAADPVAGWFTDVIGEVLAVEDLSAGAWRNDLPQAARPPAAAAQERRKFRLTTAAGRYLARFAGLGRYGEAALARARALHRSGFVAEPLTLRRGLLLQRWAEGAPLDPRGPERPAFLAHLGRYLAARAGLPAPPEAGADLGALRAMALDNALALGGPAMRAAFEAPLQALAGFRPRPVQVDARLMPWEWVRTPQGFCKADALDHCAGHDLAGCQDIAWDVAGAAVEYALTPEETARLARAAGSPAPPPVICAYAHGYAALHAAAWTLEARNAAPAERPLIRRRIEACLRGLAGLKWDGGG